MELAPVSKRVWQVAGALVVLAGVFVTSTAGLMLVRLIEAAIGEGQLRPIGVVMACRIAVGLGIGGTSTFLGARLIARGYATPVERRVSGHVPIRSLRRRAAQAGGLAVCAIGALPLLFGVSFLTGVQSIHSSRSGDAGALRWALEMAVLGAAVVGAGLHVIRWGLREEHQGIR